jgi:hypothetical protein
MGACRRSEGGGAGGGVGGGGGVRGRPVPWGGRQVGGGGPGGLERPRAAGSRPGAALLGGYPLLCACLPPRSGSSRVAAPLGSTLCPQHTLEAVEGAANRLSGIEKGPAHPLVEKELCTQPRRPRLLSTYWVPSAAQAAAHSWT